MNAKSLEVETISLLSDISKREIVLSLQYLGVSDLASAWDIRYLVDNADFFETLFEKYPLSSIDTLDDFYEFCLANKFLRMQEILPTINDEAAHSLILSLATKAGTILPAIPNLSIITFINAHIADLFSKELSGFRMRNAVLDLMEKYQTGIQEDTVAWVCKFYGFMVIDRFENWEKYLEKHPQIFDSMYPTGHLDEINAFRLSKTLEVFVHIYKKRKSALRPTVERAIPVLFEDGKKLYESSEGDGILQVEREIEDIFNFLKDIGHPLANDFAVISKKAQLLLNEHLENHGRAASYTVPVGKILQEMDKIEYWEAWMYSLSHTRNNAHLPIAQQSQLSSVISQGQTLLDLVSTNFPTDDFFTASQQQQLGVVANVCSGTVYGVMHNQEYLQHLLNGLCSEVHYICDTIEPEHDELENDMAFLVNTISLIAANMNSDLSIIHAFCFSASMLLCALAEKLMKKAYIHSMRAVKYIPAEKATMGELLNPSNAQMCEIFGENHLRNLAFFFIRTDPNKIGKNIRNSLAHWTNLRERDMNPSLVARLLWLFTDVVNTLFWFYHE